MEQWRKDARSEAIIVDLEALVPQDHLLRKIENIMDYEWIYERLDPYYCHDNGRPGTDPVVLIKMVLIQHLFGIPSLRQTHQRIQDTLSYRWFLGYGLLDEIPHFATVSYAFCKRFPEELAQEIFEHILNKALNNRMVDPSVIFIDGTHIKASANKKKFQKEQVAKAAKVYSGQLRREVNAEREKLGKKPIEDDEDDNDPQNPTGGGTTEKTVSTTDPDSGMFVKGEHERQFAYEAHTACDSRGFVLGVEVTAGNVHDSIGIDDAFLNFGEHINGLLHFGGVADRNGQRVMDHHQSSGRHQDFGASHGNHGSSGGCDAVDLDGHIAGVIHKHVVNLSSGNTVTTGAVNPNNNVTLSGFQLRPECLGGDIVIEPTLVGDRTAQMQDANFAFLSKVPKLIHLWFPPLQFGLGYRWSIDQKKYLHPPTYTCCR